MADDLILTALERLDNKQDELIKSQSELYAALQVHISGEQRLIADVSQNKKSIDVIRVDVSKNRQEIEEQTRWRETFDKIVWEIIKPPLKAAGIGVLAIIIIGALVLFK